jgi:hypothetical protein
MFLKCDPYRVWCSIFYSKLVNCILLSRLRSLFVFVKGRGTCGSGERNGKIWIDFRKSPTSNPVWVTFQEHGSSFYVNIEEKVWLLVKKILTWKDWNFAFWQKLVNFIETKVRSCEPSGRAGWFLWESLYQKQKVLYSFFSVIIHNYP